MKKASDKRVGGPPTVNISDVFGGVVALGLKSLASVDDEGLSCGGGWRRFMGPWCLLGKVGHSLGVWRARCSQPDGDRWIPAVYWRYLVWARVGWDRSQRRTGSCSSGKKQLTQDQRLLEIFGLRPTSVGDFWSGPMVVQDIWSGLTSVEYADALNEVPVGL